MNYENKYALVMKYQILLVEDDAWLSSLYQDTLELNPECKVFVANSAESALTLLDENSKIRLIILDMFLPGHNGIEFLHEMASYSDLNRLPVIVLSSVYQHDFAMNEERWRHYGVVKYLYKPTTKPQDLVVAVKKQLSAQVAK